jgi:hypothetical protein
MSRRVCKIIASNVGKTFNKDVKIVRKTVRNGEKPDRKDGKTVSRIFKNVEKDVRKTVRSEEKPGRKGDRTVDRIHSKGVVNVDEKSLVKGRVMNAEVKVEANKE